MRDPRSDAFAREFHRSITKGDTFPTGVTTPRDGDLSYRDDLENPEWFYFDASRGTGRWLSVRTYDFYFSCPSGTAGYLDCHSGIASSATFGFLLEYDMTLVQMWGLRDATGAPETYRFTANGTPIAQAFFLLAGDTKGYNNTLFVDRNAGDIIGCLLLAGSTLGDTIWHGRFRRRA